MSIILLYTQINTILLLQYNMLSIIIHSNAGLSCNGHHIILYPLCLENILQLIQGQKRCSTKIKEKFQE